jgi:hypothetical protein
MFDACVGGGSMAIIIIIITLPFHPSIRGHTIHIYIYACFHVLLLIPYTNAKKDNKKNILHVRPPLISQRLDLQQEHLPVVRLAESQKTAIYYNLIGPRRRCLLASS